ncbi:MAG TPA: OmpH family outer membrane protein, partial [Gammaproteobacteria bacterium]|nr:OmpH family outer membrane protein [Gammaproteobacteria bacterium]
NDEQQALQAEMDKFKKDAPTLSQKDKDATQKKIANERADLVKQVVSYQQDLQKAQNQAMQKIMGDLNTIVTSIANAQNFDLILDTQAVLYVKGTKGSDITKDVAKQFNQTAI